MEKIANDLIAQNNQYVIDSTNMGLIEQISDFFDFFVLKNIGKANWDVNLVKEVLRAMPKNTNLDEFCDNNTGLGYAIKMDKFVKFFNQTLENMDNAAINPQAIDFASNEEMRVKSPQTLKREIALGLEKDVNSEDFYTRPTNEEIAKTTIEGSKSQVKGLAKQFTF